MAIKTSATWGILKTRWDHRSIIPAVVTAAAVSGGAAWLLAVDVVAQSVRWERVDRYARALFLARASYALDPAHSVDGLVMGRAVAALKRAV